MHFPVSGVDVFPAIPIIVAFVISFFTSMGGVSGAFLLLPFQVSVLGFTSPAVSPTNLVYNIVAIPSGVYRYIKEKRMAWPLALDGNNIVNKIGGADRRAGKSKHAHLEREEQEGTRHPAHGCEKGNDERNDDRDSREDIDP